MAATEGAERFAGGAAEDVTAPTPFAVKPVLGSLDRGAGAKAPVASASTTARIVCPRAAIGPTVSAAPAWRSKDPPPMGGTGGGLSLENHRSRIPRLLVDVVTPAAAAAAEAAGTAATLTMMAAAATAGTLAGAEERNSGGIANLVARSVNSLS